MRRPMQSNWRVRGESDFDVAVSDQLAAGEAIVVVVSFGIEESDAFFRHFGDTDGDRDVDGRDHGQFGLTFLRSDGDDAFDPSLDFHGDGDVDGQDYARFGRRLMRRLPF